MWEGGINVPALVHNPLSPATQGKTFHSIPTQVPCFFHICP